MKPHQLHSSCKVEKTVTEERKKLATHIWLYLCRTGEELRRRERVEVIAMTILFCSLSWNKMRRKPLQTRLRTRHCVLLSVLSVSPLRSAAN